MNDQRFKEASKLFAQPAPAPIVSEYELDQQRIRVTYERLKAERLKRQAEQN